MFPFWTLIIVNCRIRFILQAATSCWSMSNWQTLSLFIILQQMAMRLMKRHVSLMKFPTRHEFMSYKILFGTFFFFFAVNLCIWQKWTSFVANNKWKRKDTPADLKGKDFLQHALAPISALKGQRPKTKINISTNWIFSCWGFWVFMRSSGTRQKILRGEPFLNSKAECKPLKSFSSWHHLSTVDRAVLSKTYQALFSSLSGRRPKG